uniref:Uncharacterized protein n=1 Tax=Aegilops tauschii subsp. strangulata TaxID=200361 RepID=A0A453IME2_AEGTS
LLSKKNFPDIDDTPLPKYLNKKSDSNTRNCPISILSHSQTPTHLHFYPHRRAAHARALRSTAMASITLLSLAPAATFLHLPA